MAMLSFWEDLMELKDDLDVAKKNDGFCIGGRHRGRSLLCLQ